MGFGFGLLLTAQWCVVGALFLLMPFRNRRRFRELVFQNPVCVWMAKRRPDLTEQVVTLYTVTWIFAVIVLVVLGSILIQSFVSPVLP